MAWLPLKTDVFYDLSVNYSSLVPFSSNSAPVFSPRDENTSFSLIESFDELDQKEVTLNSLSTIASEEIISHTNDEVLEEAVTIHTKISSLVDVDITESSFNYHVIAGSFGVIGNAEKMILKLKSQGYNSKIVDQNQGLYRVSYDGFKTKDEAIDLLVSLKNLENKSAWILSKE